MSELLPLFKSHYSIGRSILTLQKSEEVIDNGPDSIVKVSSDNGIKHLFLVDDNMSGFLEAYINSKEQGLKLSFGLRLSICNDCSDKSSESLPKTCKYTLFARNRSGYKRLIKIYSYAAKEGFYYTPRIDFKNLKKFWSNEDLKFCVPFYDSFIFNNILLDQNCVPELDSLDPTFFLEDNSLPFDYLIEERVKKYCEDKFPTQKTKSIYYNKKEDFISYLTFRCINKRTTLTRPNLDHMSSDEFSLESFLEKA